MRTKPTSCATYVLMLCTWLLAPHVVFADSYDDLKQLFQDWRAFEQPPLLGGAPDYTAATTARRYQELKDYQARLRAMDADQWPVDQQVDWHLVRAEMNGMDFYIRVLQPWVRDPAFYASVFTYQSDTPAHEGPTHHALVELWTYEFPLDEVAEAKLTAELATIPPLLQQARGNLTGNARELWEAGIRNLEDQARDLQTLTGKTADSSPEFKAALGEALSATQDFTAWLKEQSSSKTGPSGIGKDNYTWHLRNVLLVPMSWEEEVSLLKHELDRAHAALKLEEHHNRQLPPLVAIGSAEEYERRADEAVLRFTAFLKDAEILPPYDYIETALRAQTGSFVPPEKRNFFATAAHFELLTLWSHWYHWFDLARIASDPHPSPMRSGALLYNIWDSRSEGMSTAFEEMLMHAGLHDSNPRAREIIYIMVAQRAARGLGSLYVHANEFTMQQARDFHVEWTPRGWMRKDLDLLGFEQLLYLRQPGYGSSYITGKYLLERLLAERARQLGDDFRLRDWFAEIDEAGVIPVSLLRWQLTGKDDEIRALIAGE